MAPDPDARPSLPASHPQARSSPPAAPTQAASSIAECEQLKQRFQPGQAVQAWVVAVDAKKRALDVSLLPGQPAATSPAAGAMVLGRVTAVGGAGVRVQLSAHSAGRVALTDIHDAPVQQATAGLQAGQYCRAAVLGADPAAGGKEGGGRGGQLLLSLRPAAGGQCAAHAAARRPEGEDVPAVAAGALQPGDLKQGQRVRGRPVHACRQLLPPPLLQNCMFQQRSLQRQRPEPSSPCFLFLHPRRWLVM